MEQFLQIFPELRKAPLYVSGESYAGKYAPCLAIELHNHKTSSALDVNLQVHHFNIPFLLYSQIDLPCHHEI